jgi:hypothetical protein
MLFKSQQGYIGIAMAVLIIFMVAAINMMMITHSNVSRHFETAKWEKGLRLDAESLENLTTQVIYQSRESNPDGYNDSQDILTALNARKDEVSGFAEEGGSIAAVTAIDSVPVNTFFPDRNPLFAEFDESAFDLPRHLESILNAGPVEYLGNAVFTYTLSYPGRTGSFDRDIVVTAHSFEVPLINFPVTIYGRPLTGEVQDSKNDYLALATKINSSTFAAAGGTIMMTSVMNPATEEGVTNSFFDPENVGLPRMYQPFTKLSWTAYELLANESFRDRYYSAPGAVTIDANAFDAVATSGVSISGSTITIDADQVAEGTTVLNIIPLAAPGAEILINGSNDSLKSGFVMVIRNYTGRNGNIRFMSNNLRPIMILNDAFNVHFQGQTVRGAIFMHSGKADSQVLGDGTLLGHISIDSWGANASKLVYPWEIDVLPDIGVRQALAEYSPCAYIVGTEVSY